MEIFCQRRAERTVMDLVNLALLTTFKIPALPVSRKNQYPVVHHFVSSPSLKVKTHYIMETLTEIPVLKKSKVSYEKKQEPAAASCCAPKNSASVCCTPSEKPEDNGGACCAQPADGSACCDK